jgi:hypothetical protein
MINEGYIILPCARNPCLELIKAMKCSKYFGRRTSCNSSLKRSTVLVVYSLSFVALLRSTIFLQSFLSAVTLIVYSGCCCLALALTLILTPGYG